jgi:Cu2+-exporting ATPase
MTTAAQALDDRAEWTAFSRELPARAGRWESYLAIEGIDCAACTLTIEQALAGLPGVAEVQVNGAAATARVVWSPEQGRPSQWLAALRAAGFGAVPAGDLLQAAPRHQAERTMLWRWLVAGFCMMQVMMYAAPAYLAAPGEITADQQALLRWASWLLTLPVLLFSCGPFFATAARSLRARRIGMDVPVSLGILIAFGASTVATFDPQGPLGAEVWFDSVTMLVFFLLSGRLLEQRLRSRTAGALQALMRALPQLAERERADGSFESVPVRQVVAGDRVRVRAGEAFPADGIVLAGRSEVDEALLTGEPRALPRGVGDAVVAGSHNLAAPLLVRLERVGAQTQYAQIVALMERASVDKPRLARLADRIASPFLAGVLLAAAAAAAVWWPQGAGQALGIAVAVLVVTCPCALSLATPSATLAAAGALARHGVLVRRPGALETAARLDTVVFDKTGTLTHERMAVTAMRTRPGADASQVRQRAAALARHSLHPAARAVAADAGGDDWRVDEVAEVPGAGIRGRVQGRLGAPCGLRLGSAVYCDAPPADGEGPQVHLADEQGWLASFALDETLRSDARGCVRALDDAGMRTEILSGDRAAAVQRVAVRTGIATHRGGQSPTDKLLHLGQLQQGGARVAMVGDGLNDGPVLARADVSIAMGHAVPLAQSKSDFIVTGSRLAAVPMLLAHARRTRAVVRQNLAWSAGYNALCVPFALAGWLPPWLAGAGMAASSVFVVMNSARLARIRPA